MAANEVIELDSSSSEDEFKDPPRKPIGWNYQGTASKNFKDMILPKVNGAVRKPEKSEENTCNDEIEIVEVSRRDSEFKGNVSLPRSSTRPESRNIIRNTTKSNIGSMEVSRYDSEFKGNVSLPRSSTRTEIRNIIRNTTQSNIGAFLSKNPIKAEIPNKPVKTEISNKPIKTEISSKPIKTEMSKKPFKIENGSKVTDSKATDIKRTESKAADIKRTEPKTTDVKRMEPKTTDDKRTEPKTTDVKRTEPKITDVKIMEPKTTDVKITEPKTADIKRMEPKTADIKRTEPKTADIKRTEPKTTDIKRTEPKIIDIKRTESKRKTDEAVKTLSQNNNTKSEKKLKLPTVASDLKELIRQEEENWNNDDENSETSIAAVESFVSRWEELKSSSDDMKIRDKLWKYYYLAHSSYTHSRKFISQVEGSTRKLSIANIYVVVKDLLDSLKCYKDKPYADKQKKNGEASLVATSPLPDETEEDKKRNQKLRKVEKKMKEISDKIKDLETQDNDLDDEDNSAYLIEDRLKRQFSKLHDYYCKIAECTPATGRPIERKFRYSGSRYEEVNKRISAWVNKTKEFPDYVDILNLLKKVTKESNLPLRPETVRVQAQEIFRDVGKLLKDRRESDDLYSIYSYIDDAGEDPADKDESLSKKLSENENVAKDKLDKIFQEYVEREAEARVTADRNVVKKGTEDINKGGETKSTKQENEIKSRPTEGEEGQTEEEEEEYMDDYEVYEDAEVDDSDGDDGDDDNIEEINDREVVVYPSSRYDDDEDTDDELRDVIASASVEEEFSEEDVPVIDSEEVKYRYEMEDEGSCSSIVCLDDASSDSTLTLDKTISQPEKMENELPARFMDSSCKKRNFDEDFSPQKRPCLEGPKP